MGIEDHDAALDQAKKRLEAFTTEIAADPGLDDAEKEAVFTVVEKVEGRIGKDAGGLEKALKAGKMVAGLIKDPVSILGKVGGFLGL